MPCERTDSFPWANYRRFCLGVLRMQPSEFWGADTWTVMEAFDGYAISKGMKPADSRPWTKDELDELERMMKEDDERMAKANRT